MSWDNDIVDIAIGSFRGIEFGVVSTSDTLQRRVAEHVFPYRDGAEIEDLGRRARPTNIQGVFSGENYLTDLNALLLTVDGGESGPFTHPILGTWTAKCISVQVNHIHSARDTANVTIELVEDGVSSDLPDLASIVAIENAHAEAVAATSTAVAEIDRDPTGDAESATAQLTSALTDAAGFVADVNATLDNLDARFEQTRSANNLAIAALEAAYDDVTIYPAIKALRAMTKSALDLKQRLEARAPKIVVFEVPVLTSLVAIAIRLYGDPDRQSDILRLNKIRNPSLIPAGTQLRVYAS